MRGAPSPLAVRVVWWGEGEGEGTAALCARQGEEAAGNIVYTTKECVLSVCLLQLRRVRGTARIKNILRTVELLAA